MLGEVVITQDVPKAFAALAREAFETRANDESFSLVLSGGSAARPCYETLAREPINWSLVDAFWGDERCVPLDDPDSNYQLARESLFGLVTPIQSALPMNNPDDIDNYNVAVSKALPFDFCHLGVGPDGHTASIFPGSELLSSENEELVATTQDELHPYRRLTMTYNALNQSKLVVFTLIGESKRDVYQQLCNGADLPAARVNATRVVWLVDACAAE